MDCEFDAATMSIGFIGAGKMAQALTRGFLASSKPQETYAYLDSKVNLKNRFFFSDITSKERIIASAPTVQSISAIKVSMLRNVETSDNVARLSTDM
jgi:pyrroline-5-carboxylate reductase